MYLKDRYDWQFARLKFCSIIQSFMINFATASIHCNIWDPGNITATEFRELMSKLNKKIQGTICAIYLQKLCQHVLLFLLHFFLCQSFLLHIKKPLFLSHLCKFLFAWFLFLGRHFSSGMYRKQEKRYRSWLKWLTPKEWSPLLGDGKVHHIWYPRAYLKIQKRAHQTIVWQNNFKKVWTVPLRRKDALAL